MSDIAAIGGGLVGRSGPVEAGTGRATPQARVAGTNRGTDRVEVSRMASMLNQLHELPDIREELVNRVRRQIAEGGYDTPARIEGAIDGVLEEHGR